MSFDDEESTRGGTEADYYAGLGTWRSMLLPDGKTCAACCYFPRCRRLLSRAGDEGSCDWSPSRFTEAPQEPAWGLSEGETGRDDQ